MNPFKPTIKKRVMTVVKERLDQAQKMHDEEVKALDEKHKNDVKEMEERLSKRKDDLIESEVEAFLGLFVKK